MKQLKHVVHVLPFGYYTSTAHIIMLMLVPITLTKTGDFVEVAQCLKKIIVVFMSF